MDSVKFDTLAHWDIGVQGLLDPPDSSPHCLALKGGSNDDHWSNILMLQFSERFHWDQKKNKN